MIFEIPILVERRKDGDRGTLHYVRPLFFDLPEGRGRDLGKATSRLELQLREYLRALAATGDHRALAHYTFAPHVALHWLDLRLDLKSGMQRCQTALGTFTQHSRLIAFSPYLRDLWFEVATKTQLAERASAVLTRYFRDLESRQERARIERELRWLQLTKKPWLTVLELDVNTRKRGRQLVDRARAFLGSEESADGASELRRVGRLLSSLYPDDLERAVYREQLVQRLSDLLKDPRNRPILLVGNALVGKTTLVHESVFRELQAVQEQLPQEKTDARHIWQITPQRIVTGMSFVGQWEDRWLAILRHMRKKHYVLFLDDLLGLYQAGITSQSNLCAADVLKPFVDRGEVRVLAEMTPEQLRVFRERDRGFADLFHILPVDEPDEQQTLKIQINVLRQLETRFGVRFDLEVLATVLDLVRRYQPEVSFPGKAAVWLRQLAVKYQGQDVTRDDVIKEFHLQSGLTLAFVDNRQQLRREEVIVGLRRRIIGQQEAVEAMADVVSIAKARLNDPGRPLGSLFFLGPTGVGKTECSKALAAYLFSDDARLVRFDMNEFVSPDSPARLVGTFAQPEGLLTAAVRHQPFCVLLFDEIEKAHPDVFDLLLQILGEARLTQAQGRTVSFANAVIILTSNLGTREAARELGFGPSDDASAANIYQRAVQEFFRPEFFNRLDRIVPFQRLDRDEMQRIAHAMVDQATSRQGLLRRKCIVDISVEALENIVQRGYDPVLGARAMRRAVEQELVAPLARQLAGVLPETPTVLEVSCLGHDVVGASSSGRAAGSTSALAPPVPPGHGSTASDNAARTELVPAGRLAVQVTALTQSEPWPETARPAFTSPGDLMHYARRTLARIADTAAAQRPSGEIVATQVTPEYSAYLGVMELIRDAKKLLAQYDERRSASPGRAPWPIMRSGPRRKRTGAMIRDWVHGRFLLKELYSAEDVRAFCNELADEAQCPSDDSLRHGRVLLDRLALLHALTPDERGWSQERMLLVVRRLNADEQHSRDFLKRLVDCFSWASTTADDEDAAIFDLDTSYRTWTTCDVDGEVVPGSDSDYLERIALRLRGVAVVWVEGYRARRLAELQVGTHLEVLADGSIAVFQVAAWPLDDAGPTKLQRGQQMAAFGALNDWLAQCARSGAWPTPSQASASWPRELFSWQKVVTLTDAARQLQIDFRYQGPGYEGGDSLSRLLPLPSSDGADGT